MVQITIEVNRGLCGENWNLIEPFAVELIEKENRCCVCGKPNVSPIFRIHGLDVRESRVAVGLFHCSDHAGYYEIKDYVLVNGLMILRKPNWQIVGKWFNLPWWEFQKVVYSRTPFADAFPRFELNKAFIGVGNLCWKSLEIEKIPDHYVMNESEQRTTPKAENEYYPSADLEGTYTKDNVYHYRFYVPKEVYSVKEYYDKLNNAKTISEVQTIVSDYRNQNSERVKKEQPKKKKHWWQ